MAQPTACAFGTEGCYVLKTTGARTLTPGYFRPCVKERGERSGSPYAYLLLYNERRLPSFLEEDASQIFQRKWVITLNIALDGMVINEQMPTLEFYSNLESRTLCGQLRIASVPGSQ